MHGKMHRPLVSRVSYVSHTISTLDARVYFSPFDLLSHERWRKMTERTVSYPMPFPQLEVPEIGQFPHIRVNLWTLIPKVTYRWLMVGPAFKKLNQYCVLVSDIAQQKPRAWPMASTRICSLILASKASGSGRSRSVAAMSRWSRPCRGGLPHVIY